MDEGYWQAVRSVRLGIADLLDSLSPPEWEAASVCPGWRVRDVAGHLSMVPTVTTAEMLKASPRARLNPHRINTLLAVRHGTQPVDQIVRKIRLHAGERRTAAVLNAHDSLFDAIVHSQDIAIPLGRDYEVPVPYTRDALDRVWAMGWPFNARRRLRGVTLRATDTNWSAGAGPEVTSSALSLLLLATGRTSTVVDSLNGPGAARLIAGSQRGGQSDLE